MEEGKMTSAGKKRKTSKELRLNHLKKLCNPKEVDEVVGFAPEVLSMQFQDLPDTVKTDLCLYYEDVYKELNGLDTSYRHAEADRRQAEVERMLFRLSASEISKLLVANLLPASLFRYPHEEWKAKHSKDLEWKINNTTNDEDKKLLKEVLMIIMETQIEETIVPDNTTRKMGFRAGTAGIIDFEFKDESEFNPTRSIYLREQYREIWLTLQSDQNVVVVGDPGIGKSTLLRFMFGCFAFGWTCDETSLEWTFDIDSRKSVFKIMESGQYVYCDKNGKQHQGIMGRRELYEDKWRENDVWLLIDGKVDDTFLCKMTKACVFSSPEKKNFHTLLKSTNAIRIVLPPWSKAELNDFLASEGTMDQLRLRMQPYLGYLDTKMKELVLDDEDTVMSEGDACTDTPDTENIEAGKSNEQLRNQMPVGRLPVQVFSYDELDEWAAVVNKEPEGQLAFLKDHFWRRFDLVGGRIRLILNPSITFAMLKLDVQKPMNGVSAEHLEKIGSMDLLSYVPRIVYSLVPGKHFYEFYRIEFATDAIRWLMTALLTKATRTNVVKFLKECDKFNVASSLLGEVYKGLMHAALSFGGKFQMKRLIPQPKNKKNPATKKSKNNPATTKSP